MARIDQQHRGRGRFRKSPLLIALVCAVMVWGAIVLLVLVLSTGMSGVATYSSRPSGGVLIPISIEPHRATMLNTTDAVV